MQDVKKYLTGKRRVDESLDLTGYLVDTNDGLFLLGHHEPEDYDFEYRVKITNQNIIYPVLKQVPALGGGRSSLFYKARIMGVASSEKEVYARELFIQKNRSSEYLTSVDIADDVVEEYVRQYGNYKYFRSRNPMTDWLDDF